MAAWFGLSYFPIIHLPFLHHGLSLILLSPISLILSLGCLVTSQGLIDKSIANTCDSRKKHTPHFIKNEQLLLCFASFTIFNNQNSGRSCYCLLSWDIIHILFWMLVNRYQREYSTGILNVSERCCPDNYNIGYVYGLNISMTTAPQKWFWHNIALWVNRRNSHQQGSK